MRRFVGALVVLVPLSLVLAGCMQSAPENPEKSMQVQEMQMPPDLPRSTGRRPRRPACRNQTRPRRRSDRFELRT